jgi:pimeloyl-ACP methyl ester carboxylesterase
MSKNPYQQPMKPWPGLEPYAKTIRIPSLDLELFFYEAGDRDNPVLIMIHGLGDEADTWRHVIESLAQAYHVLALDLPGFGRSDKPDRDYTPAFMKKSILGLMDELEIKSAILMGSSLGGILSQGLAVEFPERVRGLILVDGALLQQEPMGDWSLRLMQMPLLGEWLYTRLRKDPDAAFDSLRNVYHDLDILPKPDRDFLYTRVNQRVWSNGQRRAYFSTLRNLTPWVKGAQDDLSKKLINLDIPTLVIRGEYDELFPEENAQSVIDAQSDVSLATIEDVNHLPQQEDPEIFLKEVKAWLKRKS